MKKLSVRKAEMIKTTSTSTTPGTDPCHAEAAVFLS